MRNPFDKNHDCPAERELNGSIFHLLVGHDIYFSVRKISAEQIGYSILLPKSASNQNLPEGHLKSSDSLHHRLTHAAFGGLFCIRSTLYQETQPILFSILLKYIQQCKRDKIRHEGMALACCPSISF